MQDNDLRELTANIVAAYVENNPIARTDLADVIAKVAAAVAALSEPAKPEGPVHVPPVSIKKSITPDYIISMEDGKPYKSLKRHLGVRGLTPEEYRKKWDLPPDYPMVAAGYSAARSALARKTGLGRKPVEAPVEVPAEKPKRTRKTAKK